MLCPYNLERILIRGYIALPDSGGWWGSQPVRRVRGSAVRLQVLRQRLLPEVRQIPQGGVGGAAGDIGVAGALFPHYPFGRLRAGYSRPTTP